MSDAITDAPGPSILSYNDIKKIYRQGSGAVRRTIHSISSNIPVVRGTASPFFASTARARASTLEGMKDIFDVGGRARAGGRFSAWQQSGFQSTTQQQKLQRIALAVGLRKERNNRISGKVPRHPTEKLIAEARKIVGDDFVGNRFKSQSKGVKLARTTGMIKQAFAGTREGSFFKSYQNAILNPRNVIMGGAVFAGVKIAQNAYQSGLRSRTENIGQGRFGTDTRGSLGPASIKGMRFKVSKRRRLI